MKQCYLLLILLCMTLSAFSQETPRLHWKDIAQNPSLLTPAVALSLSKQGFDKDGYLPPVGQLPYNLTDSAHYSLWDPLFNEWLPFERTYYVNDCDLGLTSSRLVKRRDAVTGNFYDRVKTNYTYFPNGREKTTVEELWLPSTNEWVEVKYVSNIRPGEPEEERIKQWNEFTQSFIVVYRTVYEYNAEEQLVRSDNYDLDTLTDTWVLSSTIFFTYENGKLVLEQTGNYDMGTWTASSQSIYTYDSNGNAITQSFEWDYGLGWEQDQLYTNTYDSENRLVERLIQLNNNGVLEDSQKNLYSYYPNNQNKAQNFYTWVSSQQAWLLTFQGSFKEDGQLLYFISKYGYDEPSGGFLYGLRFDYTYNSNDLLTEITTASLIASTLDDWQPNDKYTISYDGNDRELAILLQTWDEVNDVYNNNNLTDFFNTGCLYSGVGNTHPVTVDYSYVNPIMLGQPIDCPALEQYGEQTLRLYNMTGQEVHAQSFRSGDSLQPHQALAPGMYVLTITGSGGLSYRSKVVVL